MRVRCNSCGGEYDTVQPDGLAYYHVCPPITCVRATRADGSRAIVNIAKLAPTDTIRVRRGADLVDALVSDLLPDDARVDEVFIERPNKRDERAQRIDAKTVAMISAGTGVTEVQTPAPSKRDPVIL